MHHFFFDFYAGALGLGGSLAPPEFIIYICSYVSCGKIKDCLKMELVPA